MFRNWMAVPLPSIKCTTLIMNPKMLCFIVSSLDSVLNQSAYTTNRTANCCYLVVLLLVLARRDDPRFLDFILRVVLPPDALIFRVLVLDAVDVLILRKSF